MIKFTSTPSALFQTQIINHKLDFANVKCTFIDGTLVHFRSSMLATVSACSDIQAIQKSFTIIIVMTFHRRIDKNIHSIIELFG